MRIFLGDSLMESIIRLPKYVQKKAIDFPKKFQINSKAASIHLEPISTFLDDSLRTARITDKYRAIIGVVPKSDKYFFLWVDNHDEAMKWAKNKRFEWNSYTNSPQLFTVEEVVEKQRNSEVENVETQKRLFSDDILLQIGVPNDLLSLVRNISTFDDLENVEKKLPQEAFEHLFYLLDGHPIDTLLEELKENLEEDENGVNRNFKRYFVQVDDELLEKLLKGELEKWQLFLHPTQQKTISKSFNGSVKITGGAGTGKTVAALHRLKYLAGKKEDQRKILFATFTKTLKKNLDSLAKRLDVDESTYIISNVDAIVYEIALNRNLIDKSTRILGVGRDETHSSKSLWDTILESEVTEFTPEFLEKETSEIIQFYNLKTFREYAKQPRHGRGIPINRSQRKEVWTLYQLYLQLKKEKGLIDRLELFNSVSTYLQSLEPKLFSHVIVDEVQDLSNVELRFIRSLVEDKRDDLFLVGDPFQSIYDRKISFIQSGINIRGKRSFKLKVNYRTTEEIRKFAISAVKTIKYSDFEEGDEKLDGYISLFHGLKPSYKLKETKNEEHEYIEKTIRDLQEEGVLLREIAVAARINESIREVKTHFHNRNIPYYDLKMETGDSNGVRLCTFHSLKGLEFKIVFLIDVNQRTLPYRHHGWNYMGYEEKERYIKSEKSLLYVASTRAINNLYISGIGQPSNLVKL